MTDDWSLSMDDWWLITDDWWRMIDDWWLMSDEWWLMIDDKINANMIWNVKYRLPQGGPPWGKQYGAHFILYLYLPYHQSSPIIHQSPVINHQSSIISYQSSVINHQLSIINHPWSMINHQSSITSHLFFYEKKRTSATKWVGNRIHEVLIGGIGAEIWGLSLLQLVRGVIKGCW